MEIKYKKTSTVDVSYEVDDRICQENSLPFKVADILLNNALQRIIDRSLYSDSATAVEYAASTINDAFCKADKILFLVTKGSPPRSRRRRKETGGASQ